MKMLLIRLTLEILLELASIDTSLDVEVLVEVISMQAIEMI